MLIDQNEYIARYMGLGQKIFEYCRIWDADRETLLFYNIHEIPIEHRRKIRTHPIGMPDDEGTQIYQGDVLRLVFDTPQGEMILKGAVRSQGVYCCGVDFIRDGKIDEEDGMYIDEPYIKQKNIIGNVFEGWE